MFKNNAFMTEKMFVYELNDKHLFDLNKNLSYFVKHMFPTIKDDDIIKCEFVKGFQKPDVVVSVGEEKKYVSVKSYKARLVHSEYLSTFIPFLREIGMPEDDIQFLLKWHYGDDTTDGSGIDHYDYEELRYRYRHEIKKFNFNLLEKKDLIKKLIYRCLFKGSKPEKIEADYIYHGTVDMGYFCTKRQIFTHIDNRKWGFMNNPHIGPLQFRAHIRGKKFEDEEKEKERHQIYLWWANLGDDIKFISERYKM